MFKIILIVESREELSSLSYTVDNFIKLGIFEKFSVTIYSKFQLSKIFNKGLIIIDRSNSILKILKGLNEDDSYLFCVPGVGFRSIHDIFRFFSFISENRNMLVGGICSVRDSKIRGYSLNKNFLNLSPIRDRDSGGVEEVDLVRFVIGIHGSILKNVLISDISLNWDIQLSNKLNCLSIPVIIDVSNINRKLKFKK